MSFDGELTVIAGERTLPGRARLGGHVEPVDGRFHWMGRLAPDDAIAALVRTGTRAVQVQVAAGPRCEARLSEVDPWGGVRVSGVGVPPWVVP
jgi:hypothetical protein